MVHRSGQKKKLNLDGTGDSSSPRVPKTSVSEQKAEQEATKTKMATPANIDAFSGCCESAKGKVNRIRNAIEAAHLDYKRIYIADPTRKHEFEPKFVEFEELYEFTRIAISEMIDEHGKSQKVIKSADADSNQPQPGTSGSGPPVRATPTIVLHQAALPVFDGRYDNWFKFKQMFRDIADKCTGDSAATKLHFLDKALVGRAQGSIDQQIIRDNDYEGAWTSLTQQYENLPALISDTILKLLNLKMMTNESFQQLKMLTDEVEKCKGKGANLLGRPIQPAAAKAHTVTIQKTDGCYVCSENHLIDKCDTFKKLNVEERYEKAKQIGLCFACLKKGHRTTNCKNSTKCSKCSRRHHLMLHPEDQSSQKEEKSQVEATVGNASEKPKNEATVMNCVIPGDAVKPMKQVLLATALVNVFDVNGKQHRCRILLDSGAMTNFVSKQLVDMLRLKKNYVNIPVTGVNGMTTAAKFSVRCKIKSNISDREFCLEYLVVPRVTAALPATRLDVQDWPIPTSLHLADPKFYEPSCVDMLVGAEAFFSLLLSGKIEMTDNLPVLQESQLGWLVSGPFVSSSVTAVRSYHATTLREADKDLVSILKKFWAVDNQFNEIIEDDLERHFVETFTRNDKGQYVVRLPFRTDAGILGDLRRHAEKRLYQLERRLEKDTKLKNLYSQFVTEYIELGHCKILPETETNSELVYYMPHHCVLRPGSSSTKLRVVFDASAKSSSGKSLNDLLMIGPSVQDSLFDIVLRFRFYRYAFTADVQKMYRMILVDERDTSFQRILWRDDKTKKLKEIN
ncbi:uncharacterized protein LOC129719664 [Wyeomyia smithii]|uniref:uncharacterized protein LOC129719664 n=1 Tax=Wyeomyia smithii TaxID=174621 RepID=UPI0024680644|nr:uncharacterized protein LOC129719664 [Wyeomyia smithii]